MRAFRHFFASWSINPEERCVCGLLSITMTLDSYGHPCFRAATTAPDWRSIASVAGVTEKETDNA